MATERGLLLGGSPAGPSLSRHGAAQLSSFLLLVIPGPVLDWWRYKPGRLLCLTRIWFLCS